MSKLVAKPELFLEEVEVNRLRELLEDTGFRFMFALMSESFGIIKKAGDTNFNALKMFPSTGGYAGIKSGYAMDSKGQLIVNASDIQQAIAVEVDNPDQYVYISYDTTQIEKGSISVATNGNITGLGTEFLKILKAGKSIEVINSVSGNNGVYEIKSVTNDLTCAINGTFKASESTLSFKVVGTFTPGVVIPEGDKRPYYYDSFKLTIESSSTNGTNDKFLLAKVTNTGSQVIVTDLRSATHYFKKSLPEVLNAAYTTSETFKVGGQNGRFVLTESEVPPEIQNFRIASINSTSLSNIHTSMTGLIAQVYKNSIDNYMNVRLKWGWDDITGYGGNNTFTINNSAYTFLTDQLKGLYIYIPTVDKNLKILSNLATSGSLTVCQVEEEGGLAWDGTFIELKDQNKGWMHFNADSYDIVALPVVGDPINNTYDYTNRIEATSAFGSRVVRMETTMRLHMGQYYLIEICAKNGTVYNNYVELPAGTFTQYNMPQNYEKPVLIKHPSIADDGVIALSTSLNGFNATIDANCWKNADNFEIAYTTENSTADFLNPNHNPTLMTGRSIAITTNTSAEFNVSIRPLISGQAVAPAKSAKIVSGSAGRAPDEKLLAIVDISHVTFSGSLSYNSTTIDMVTIDTTSLETPSASGRSTSTLGDGLIGEIMTINDIDYRITGREKDDIYYIEPVQPGAQYPATGTHNFTVGVSQLAREQYNHTFITSTFFTRAEVDPKYVSGEGVVLRIYEKTKEEKADYIDIAQSGVAIPQALNLKMIIGESTMNLKVDLYDSNGNLNNNMFLGRLVIYGREYVDMASPGPKQV